MPERLARATMLIHAAPFEVFNAFVAPEKITKFWLAKTSGPLAPGATVHWEFMVPGARETVCVRECSDSELVVFDWSSGLTVRIALAPFGKRSTRVEVLVNGFADGDNEDSIVDTTEGFAIVLCDLKTFLESGRSAGLVRAKAELIAATR